jgi:hypothetical protein
MVETIRESETVREPYQLGNYYTSMPIPAIPEHCISLDAGALTLVVESRQLTDDLANAALEAQLAAEVQKQVAKGLDDFGATLHVCGTADGLEHLRFDCFEHEPHYHYVRNADRGNLVCRIDQYAEGDPIEWTLGRLRERLPEMLEFAGVPELADQARADRDRILAVIDDVAELLGKARVQAVEDRAARS